MYSMLQPAFDRASMNVIDDFHKDQKKLVRVPGPYADPFGFEAPAGDEWRGVFEALPKPHVAWAWDRIKERSPHGSCVIILNSRPTNDEKVLHGAPDWLASTDPSWWVAAAGRGGVMVTHYEVTVGQSVVLHW